MDIYGELVKEITDMVLEAPENCFQRNVHFYEPPLVGIASAEDSLFLTMKKTDVVGDLFRTPQEWLPGCRSVVSYFLPWTMEIRRSNYPQSEASSDEWLWARIKGEEFNDLVRKKLISLLEKRGAFALAPALEKSFQAKYITDDGSIGGVYGDMEVLKKAFDAKSVTYSSNWSERHAAFVAGLGTFSLNRGLITARGMAGRFGSVVTTLEISPTQRPYSSPFEYCPWLKGEGCGECIGRCPSGAITGEAKNNKVCHKHLFGEQEIREIKDRYGFSFRSCGKCQTAVPCEHCIP